VTDKRLAPANRSDPLFDVKNPHEDCPVLRREAANAIGKTLPGDASMHASATSKPDAGSGTPGNRMSSGGRGQVLEGEPSPGKYRVSPAVKGGVRPRTRWWSNASRARSRTPSLFGGCWSRGCGRAPTQTRPAGNGSHRARRASPRRSRRLRRLRGAHHSSEGCRLAARLAGGVPSLLVASGRTASGATLVAATRCPSGMCAQRTDSGIRRGTTPREVLMVGSGRPACWSVTTRVRVRGHVVCGGNRAETGLEPLRICPLLPGSAGATLQVASA